MSVEQLQVRAFTQSAAQQAVGFIGQSTKTGYLAEHRVDTMASYPQRGLQLFLGVIRLEGEVVALYGTHIL